MAIAYHLVLGAYGFWLPNDPRGSWSDFVWSWELLRFGKPVKARSRQSLAHAPCDPKWQGRAKAALKYPAAVFTEQQMSAIGSGFAAAIDEGVYRCFACAIMPEHVHIVLARHERSAGKIVGHLRSKATARLRDEGLWDAERPVWGENCWKVYLDDEADVGRSVAYTNDNLSREERPPQDWPFVIPWNAEVPLWPR
jgi:REP element-mobilizing transposase RayT